MDTGVSSKTIWEVMTGLTLWDLTPDTPHDPIDFGRCYRLLQKFPDWEARLPEVARRHPAWSPFVNAWTELKALWEEESPAHRCPKLFARMRELRGY